MVEYAQAIIGFLSLLGGIVGSYITLNIKVQKINGKVENIEDKLVGWKEEKAENQIRIEKAFDKLEKKLDSIDEKLDIKFDILTKIKIEHEQNMEYCRFIKKNNDGK